MTSLVEGYRLLQKVFRAFSIAEVAPFDEPAAIQFEELSKRHLRITSMDLRIAAIALSRGLTLVTRNRRDFSKIAELPTEDWTTAATPFSSS